MRLLNFHAKLKGKFRKNDEECHVSEVKNQDTKPKISLWSKKQLGFIEESLIFIKRFYSNILINANLQPNQTPNRFEPFC